MKPLKAFSEIIDEQSAVIKAANRKIANGAEIDWRIICIFSQYAIMIFGKPLNCTAIEWRSEQLHETNI